ncbi:alpha-N-acetylgalactosaminide alpha-2,6-sialyltransferase 1 [Choloepus didactylus]|uniref:alpha-N-acetylgalactosaminide alpha-2,6-sialyltransferase 1 n=1 Tax=Choloepus didactylus TaxID=27675 RepID=UPI00189F9B95|nr:alpha-N-acetylgalactosaminide alpha-2,6-sialyltransferase 1 [Choloepus didactylus]
MRACLRRLGRLGQAVQWPLLWALLLFFLFVVPSFIKEPKTKPSRYQDTVKLRERSAESLRKADSQTHTMGRTTVHIESLQGNSARDMWLETTGHTAKENRTAEAKRSLAAEAPAEGQGKMTATAKTVLLKSREKEKIMVEMLSPKSQDKGMSTFRAEALSMKTTKGRRNQNKNLTTTRTVLVTHQDNGVTTSEGQDAMVTTKGTASTGNRKEEMTTAASQEKRTFTKTKTKAKPKVRLEDQTPKPRAQDTTPSTHFQRPTTQRVQRLKASNFKSEPQWDFEENYSLEVGGLQTTCPDSVKVKASRSLWLQNLFLPNLTLFLDSRNFNRSEWDRLEHFAPPFGFMELNYSLVQKVVAHFPPVPQQQLLLANRPGGPPECISCAVVGNGGILNNSRMGQEIDSHDYVFRLSGAVIKGYEQDVGTRTSFYGFTAFSLTQSLLILGHRGFQHVPLGKDIRYLHFLEGTRDFEWLEALLLNQTVKGNSFSWFRHRPREAFREALRLDRYLLLHPDLLRYMKNRFLKSKTLNTAHWRIYRPTTGALLLLTALQLCDRVSAYGFITEGHERFSDHYYDKTWKPLIFYLNHDFRLEREVWKKLHHEGLIQLYQQPVPSKAKN